MRSAENDSLGIPEEQARQLRLAVMALARRLRREHAAELPLTQIQVLGAAERLGERANPTDIARQTGMAGPNVATALTALDAADLIARTRDHADARRVHITLTDTGRSLLDRDRRTREHWLQQTMSSRLAPEEQEVLLRATALLRRVADEA